MRQPLVAFGNTDDFPKELKTLAAPMPENHRCYPVGNAHPTTRCKDEEQGRS